MAALFYLEYKFISQLFTVVLCLQLSGSPSAGPGGIITNLNPRAQSLMDGLLDQICEILIPLSLRFSDSRLSSRGWY